MAVLDLYEGWPAVGGARHLAAALGNLRRLLPELAAIGVVVRLIQLRHRPHHRLRELVRSERRGAVDRLPGLVRAVVREQPAEESGGVLGPRARPGTQPGKTAFRVSRAKSSDVGMRAGGQRTPDPQTLASPASDSDWPRMLAARSVPILPSSSCHAL